MAHQLLADGCRVAVIGRHPDGVVRVVHGYSADRVLAIAADTTDERQWHRVTEVVRDRFGRLDTVIRAVSSETAVRSHDRWATRSPRSLGAEVWAQSSSAS